MKKARIAPIVLFSITSLVAARGEADAKMANRAEEVRVDVQEDPRPIVRIHDTSVNPFLLSDNGMEAGDPFPSYWDGVWHLYS